MLDFPLMLWVKLPIVDRIHPQSNKFAMGTESKAAGDSNLNDGPGFILQSNKSCIDQVCMVVKSHTSHS